MFNVLYSNSVQVRAWAKFNRREKFNKTNMSYLEMGHKMLKRLKNHGPHIILVSEEQG